MKNTVGGYVLVCVLAVVAWVILQASLFDFFIFHDAWKHNFPRVFDFALEVDCFSLLQWRSTVDSGSPTLIDLASLSLTHAFRPAAILAMSCLQVSDLETAIGIQKVQILVSAAVFSAGLTVLGLLLYRDIRSSLYLGIVSLYAGPVLHGLHSDQTIYILFWAPWIMAAVILAHRHRASLRGGIFFSIAAVLVSLQSLDQYPHFIAVVGVAASVSFFVVYPKCLAGIRWPAIAGALPGLAVLALTVVQMVLIGNEIADFQPSQRAGIIVDPSQFGETGFVQETALLGLVFPATLLAGFEGFAVRFGDFLGRGGVSAGATGFIFRLDAVLFSLGLLPLVLAGAFFFDRHRHRLKWAWIIFLVAILAVSLQSTGLYFLLFNIPSFDIFRSYFLFGGFFVSILLIMGAYGLDAILTADRGKERLRFVTVVLSALVLMTVVAGGVLVWMASYGDRPGLLLDNADVFKAGLIDVAGWGVAILALVTIGIKRTNAGMVFAIVLAATVLNASVYTWHAFETVGISRAELAAAYGVREDADRKQVRQQAPSLFRNPCTVFAECYVNAEPTTSVRRDHEGTFLRHRSEPIFIDDLASSVLKSLSGIDFPVFWVSSALTPALDRADIVRRLNAEKENVAAFLSSQTLVAGPASRNPPNEHGRESTNDPGFVNVLHWGNDRFVLEVTTSKEAFLNASIAPVRFWQVRVNKTPVDWSAGNLNGIVFGVPAGVSTVEITYSNKTSEFVIYSRLLLVVVGLFFLVGLAVASISERRHNVLM